MNTTRTTFTPVRDPYRGPAIARVAQDAAWVGLFAALVGCVLALLFAAVGPAPVPERMLDALVFGASLVLLEGLLQSRGPREMLALVVAATAVAVIGATVSRVLALVVFMASFGAWRLHARWADRDPTRLVG